MIYLLKGKYKMFLIKALPNFRLECIHLDRILPKNLPYCLKRLLHVSPKIPLTIKSKRKML